MGHVLPVLISVLCLLAAYTYAQAPLTLGTSVQTDVNVGTMQVWTLSDYLPKMQDNSLLRIVATPLSGDVDLYVQFNTAPTTASSAFSSTSGQGDLLILTKTQVASGAPLYIGVNPLVASSVVVNTFISNSDVIAILNDGVPQVAETSSSESTYFKFQLDTASNFTISVTPFSGDPDIYVSTITEYPNFANNSWRQRRYGYDLLDIDSTNPAYVAGPATYYIAIWGYGISRYAVSVTKRESISLLMEGVPQAEDLRVSEWMYFKFVLREEHLITFSLTAFTYRGDPDIYVKKDAMPSLDNYDYHSRRFGEDVLPVPNAQPGTYYVGVHGYSQTAFQIVVTTEKSTEVLVDGAYSGAILPAGGAQYYKFYAGDTETGLVFSVVPRFGSVTMYASKTSSRPSATKNDFVSRNLGTESVIYVPSPITTGYYFLGVFANSATNYTIRAQTNHTTTILQDGALSFWNNVPYQGYRYFVYVLGDHAVDLTVTVRPELTKDVDVYISTTTGRPTTTNYQWSANRGGADTVTIASDDPLKAGRTTFFIAVYGFQASYFSILAFTSNSNLQLVDATPFPAVIQTAGTYRFFSFYMNGEGSLTINLEVPTGGVDADFFVSRSNRKPTNLNYDWRSTNFGSDFYRIDNAYQGYYHIGVTVFGDNATFVLTASTLFQYVYDGSSGVTDVVEQGMYRVYRTNVYARADRVIFASTLINGATQMYISNNASIIPGPDNYTWKSTDWPGNLVVVQKTDPNFVVGQWSISMFGAIESDYYLTVQSGIALISGGVPRLGASMGAIPTSYSYYVRTTNWMSGEVADDVVINIRVFFGKAEVYATQNRTTTGPSATAYDFTSSGSGVVLLRIPKARLNGGSLYVNVFAGQQQHTRYLISISAMSEPKYLTQEQPIDFISPAGATEYFQVLAARSADALLMTLDSCSDVVPTSFYVSTAQKPNQTSHEFASTAFRTYSQYIVSPTVKPNTVYYAAVTTPTQLVYQMYTTTKFFMNPAPGGNGVVTYAVSKTDTTVYVLTFTVATSPSTQHHVTHYKVYKRQIPKNTQPNTLNFRTQCAIELLGTLDGEIRSNQTTGTINYEINLDMSAEYLYAVVAENGLGLTSPYHPIHVRIIPAGGLGAGWVIIILALVGIVLYLVGGAGYNYMKGGRGIELIPNIKFWVGLPYLVRDGFKFVFTGEFLRSGSTYNRMGEDSVNASSGERVTATSSSAATGASSADQQQSAATGGYGSIV